MMGLAWGLAYFLAPLYTRGSSIGKNLTAIFALAFVSAWIGAKLLFMLTLSVGEMSIIGSRSSFWLGGGMVFYGGFIGGLLALLIYASIKKLNYSDLFLLTPILPLAHSVGRWGCIFAGCCYGKESHGWWTIHLHGAERHPVQFYESSALLLLFVVLHFLSLKKINGAVQFLIYACGYALIRFSLEFLRGDTVRGIYALGLSTSQWVSIAIIIFSLILIASHSRARRNK